MRYAFLALGLFALQMAAAPHAGAEGKAEERIVTHTIEGEFNGVLSNLRFAIQNQGLVLSGESHLQEMLDRTAEDLGYEEGKYLRAVSFEFCSALLAHKMFISDRRNVATCPMTVAAYVLPETPDTVYLAYRKPLLAVDDRELEEEIEALYEAIVEDTTAW